MENNATNEKPLKQEFVEWSENLLVSTRTLTEKAQQALLNVAQYEDKARAYDELVARLHASQRHPDFLYATQETGRKSGGDDIPPEGHGWVRNIHKGDEGWERFDHTEETYWMRLKEDAKQDPIYPWDLKPIVLPRVKRDQLLDMVRERVNPGYMPGEFIDLLKATTVTRPQFNSKPTYLKGQPGLVKYSQHDPSGFFAYMADAEVDEDNPFWKGLHPKPSWYAWTDGMYASLRLPNAHILIDLKKEKVMISAYNPHGFAGPWVEWSPGDSIALDTTELEAQINSL